MPGVLELAQYIFQNRVRIAEPNYIGVREPQYTTAVGLIKHACKKARIQKNSAAPVTAGSAYENREQSQTNAAASTERTSEKSITEPKKCESKFKKFLGYFFE